MVSSKKEKGVKKSEILSRVSTFFEDNLNMLDVVLPVISEPKEPKTAFDCTDILNKCIEKYENKLMGCPSLVERVSFGKKDTLGRGGGHGDREKAGTGAELFVLWAGAGFSWKLGAGGAQWGRLGGSVQEEGVGRESEGCPERWGSPGLGPRALDESKKKELLF